MVTLACIIIAIIPLIPYSLQVHNLEITLDQRSGYQPRNLQATTTDSGLSFPENSDISQGQRHRYRSRNRLALTIASEATTTDSGLSFPEDSDISQGQRHRYRSRNRLAFTIASEATTTDSGLSFPEDSDISQGQRPRYRSLALPLGTSPIESSHSFKKYSAGPSSRARFPARRVCAPSKTTPISPLEDSNRPHPQRKRAVPLYETLTTVCSDGTVIKVTSI